MYKALEQKKKAFQDASGCRKCTTYVCAAREKDLLVAVAVGETNQLVPMVDGASLAVPRAFSMLPQYGGRVCVRARWVWVI